MDYNNPFNNGYGRFKFLMLIPVAAVLSLIVMLLWNKILPGLVHVGFITYWQSVGLLVLSKILFGGFNWIGRGGTPPLRAKFMNLSIEEREKIKAQWQERNRQRSQKDN